MTLTAACDRTPEGVLSKEEMAALIVDIHKGEAAIDLSNGRLMSDSMRLAVRQSVYDAHNVTGEQFDSSLVYYGHHIEDYLEVYDMAIEQLQTQFDNAEAVGLQTAQTAVTGDSVDLWPLPRRVLLGPASPARMITWELNRDSSWEPGDTYYWGFKVVNSESPVNVRMLADYADGTVEWIDGETHAEGRWLTLAFTLDTVSEPLRIFGIAQADGAASQYVYLDSITLTRSHRNADAPQLIRYRYRRFKP